MATSGCALCEAFSGFGPQSSPEIAPGDCPRTGDGLHLPSALEEISERRTLLELEDTDVLYVAGIPHGALDEAGRTRLRVTPGTLERCTRVQLCSVRCL